MATPEKGSEAPLAEQQDDHHSDCSPPARRERQSFRDLAELLETVAAIVAELEREEPVVEERAPELRGAKSSIVASRQRESSSVQLTHVSAILFVERDGEPAKSESPPSSPIEIPSLLFVKEFMAAGGGWVAFKCRFQMNCDFAGWTVVEALRRLLSGILHHSVDREGHASPGLCPNGGNLRSTVNVRHNLSPSSGAQEAERPSFLLIRAF
ncbi:unnamed protein product [Lampetra planeri]